MGTGLAAREGIGKSLGETNKVHPANERARRAHPSLANGNNRGVKIDIYLKLTNYGSYFREKMVHTGVIKYV